jgi:hypothetical protein
MIMIDIIPSPATRSLTPDTYHKYYLGIIEVASRFFVPMGIQDKMPTTVYNALVKWALWHGPTSGYTISSIEQVHGDFDTTFGSREFTRLMTDQGIRTTYAAPRHQEQKKRRFSVKEKLCLVRQVKRRIDEDKVSIRTTCRDLNIGHTLYLE